MLATMTLEDTEVRAFSEILGIEETVHLNLQLLTKIIQRFMDRVPFQNLTMLIRPRQRPTWDEIRTDMLSGLGGLCTTRNPYLKVYLEQLGFNVHYISSSMQEPDCHIGLVVRIENTDYWVDVGNGYPYLWPAPMNKARPATYAHPFFSYRLRWKDDGWVVEHKKGTSGWVLNQSLGIIPVDYCHFDRMHELHYTQPEWGPFLTGIRMNRWWVDGGVILRDRRAVDPNGEQHLASYTEFKSWSTSWFDTGPFVAGSILQQAWSTFELMEG